MSDKAKTHARRVGEIMEAAKQHGSKKHKYPGTGATLEEIGHWNWSVDQAALGWLAAEHANALDRIAELERDLAVACGGQSMETIRFKMDAARRDLRARMGLSDD